MCAGDALAPPPLLWKVHNELEIPLGVRIITAPVPTVPKAHFHYTNKGKPVRVFGSYLFSACAHSGIPPHRISDVFLNNIFMWFSPHRTYHRYAGSAFLFINRLAWLPTPGFISCTGGPPLR